MKGRKDKIVDFFRCFFLGLAIALAILLGVIGYSVYRSSQREIDDPLLVIVDNTEAATENLTEYMPTDDSEADQSGETQQTMADEPVAEETAVETEATSGETTGETGAATSETYGDVLVVDGEEVTEETEEESTGIYTTLLQSCNFRSEASYTDDDGNDTTICSYEAGTTVEYLETVGGWVKVRIDGVVGYIGARFIDIS
ncbi:MAG: hypothetical protein LUF30_01140 [Lachnospiraceae bacterium]|nr:hypothetical protein [Lachnospiraceae bacterium]